MTTDYRNVPQQDEIAAEYSGANAWAHGVPCNPQSYETDVPRILEAWRRGWINADNKQRRRRGEPESNYYGY